MFLLPGIKLYHHVQMTKDKVRSLCMQMINTDKGKVRLLCLQMTKEHHSDLQQLLLQATDEVCEIICTASTAALMNLDVSDYTRLQALLAIRSSFYRVRLIK